MRRIVLFASCLVMACSWVVPVFAEESIYPGQDPPAAVDTVASRTVTILDADGVKGTLEGGDVEFLQQPRPALVVKAQQVQIKMPDTEAVLLTAQSSLSWAWQKGSGKVCIVQLALRNATTGQVRYFGYAAGAWSEDPSPDPTVEVFLSTELPTAWREERRPILSDIKTLLGWDNAEITGIYLSPWDGQPASFADIRLESTAVRAATGSAISEAFDPAKPFVPQRLARADEKHVDRLETSFDECMPGRNSAANEWSTFGIDGDRDFNCMGRGMHVRYPIFDLVFRLSDADREIDPGTLDSFRLGLLNNRLPAIWGAWVYQGMRYRVTAMTTPGGELGNYDLFKLEIQNPGTEPAASLLQAILEGPPDMHLEDEVVRGLGDAPFLVAEGMGESSVTFREWGLCDKRAKACNQGGGPGETEPAMSTCRVGLDGVPVVYRFRAEPGKRYSVYAAASPTVSGYLLENPKEPGDWVLEYTVEGCAPQTLDYVVYMKEKSRPLCVGFDGARDENGDGYIEVRSGVSVASRIRHTRLSVIYVLPDVTKVNDMQALCAGKMNEQCVWHIDVGITPEQSSTNQEYDKSDIGFARLGLAYAPQVAPGETKTFWLKIPAIHRREPVSMGYIAHAFRDILPGEAVPPFEPDKVAALKAVVGIDAERAVVAHWEAFFTRAAGITTPDRVLSDLFLSRLATRALLDVRVEDGVYYNACSPFFYFDHAYRDQAYVVYAYDLGGLHDRAERILNGYCKDVKDIKTRGPISFDGQPLQLGMEENGLWKTRPGQFDTQGENIWALVQHYKLSGDREWLERTAYPFVRRGAMWIVNSRHKHMDEVRNPDDPRYGLVEPGAMEVMEVGGGMHMYYLSAFGVLGLREAADAAQALDLKEDAALFDKESVELKASLHRSFEKTFKRLALYEGHLWFGVEPEGVGMYGFWAHNALLWPCRALEPHDPMLTATFRRMERMANEWGGGMHSEGAGGYWPYIGVDRAVGHILRGEPDQALDYFCAFTDTAGGTLSWGEGYTNRTACGDEPHMWADAQWVNLFRHMLAFEDGDTLMLTPATFRRWTQGTVPVKVQGLPTAFGALDLDISASPNGNVIEYTFRITPRGDQANRPVDRVLIYPRVHDGLSVKRVECNGTEISEFTNAVAILPSPDRGKEYRLRFETNFADVATQ